jgi:hypothetical protein
MQSSFDMRRQRPVILCLAVALLVPASALPAQGASVKHALTAKASNAAQTTRGIVQEIRKDRIRLRALDGSDTWVRLALKAQILVNDRPGILRDIRPGFVAEVVRNKLDRVSTLRAFGEVPLSTIKGVVDEITATGIVVRRGDGTTVLFTIDPATKILLYNQPATVADVLVGFSVSLQYRGSAPPEVISALPPITIDRGAIVEVTPTAITLRRPAGRVTLVLDAATIALVGGQPTAITALKPAQIVAVEHRGTAPATTIRVLPGKG